MGNCLVPALALLSQSDLPDGSLVSYCQVVRLVIQILIRRRGDICEHVVKTLRFVNAVSIPWHATDLASKTELKSYGSLA